jgi:hypothetical protein
MAALTFQYLIYLKRLAFSGLLLLTFGAGAYRLYFRAMRSKLTGSDSMVHPPLNSHDDHPLASASSEQDATSYYDLPRGFPHHQRDVLRLPCEDRGCGFDGDPHPRRPERLRSWHSVLLHTSDCCSLRPRATIHFVE